MCQLLNRAQKAGKPLVVCCAGLRLEEAQDRVAVGDPSLLKALKMEVHFAKKVLVPERPTPCKRAAEAEARDEETLAKKRKIMSEQQERALEEAFEKNPWLSKEEKTELSEQIGLKYTTVQGFFAKKRRGLLLHGVRPLPTAVEEVRAAALLCEESLDSRVLEPDLLRQLRLLLLRQPGVFLEGLLQRALLLLAHDLALLGECLLVASLRLGSALARGGPLRDQHLLREVDLHLQGLEEAGVAHCDAVLGFLQAQSCAAHDQRLPCLLCPVQQLAHVSAGSLDGEIGWHVVVALLQGR